MDGGAVEGRFLLLADGVLVEFGFHVFLKLGGAGAVAVVRLMMMVNVGRVSGCRVGVAIAVGAHVGVSGAVGILVLPLKGVVGIHFANDGVIFGANVKLGHGRLSSSQSKAWVMTDE